MKELDVSILLCAYNASQFINEAVDSILYQSYGDFELVFVDDGSTDNTLGIVQGYEDQRIRIIPSNHDYISSLNKGLTSCRGKYIVRMDSDDIMEHNRISIQKRVMDIHPEITVCTSWAQTIGVQSELIGNSKSGFINNIDILFLLGNFLIHPTAIIRRDFIDRYNIKYKKYPYAEDFKLWTDIELYGGVFYVLPHPLLLYRTSPLQLTRNHWEEQEATRIVIQQEIIEREINKLNPGLKRLVRRLYGTMLDAYNAGLLSPDKIISVMYNLFNRLRGKQY